MGHNSYDSADDPALAAVQAAFEADMRVLVGKFELYARGNLRFGLRKAVDHGRLEEISRTIHDLQALNRRIWDLMPVLEQAMAGPEK